MHKLRVLVADDSAFNREFVCAVLGLDASLVVVGEAANGLEATQKAIALRPDLIIMDIEMPVMDGLEATSRIMAEAPVPILVFTGHATADNAFEALSRGALEVLSKDEVSMDNARAFIDKIKLLSHVKVITHILKKPHPQPTKSFPPPPTGSPHVSGLVAIASSTGGPKALAQLLGALPADFPLPILVAQHIQDEFIKGMVEWLGAVTPLRVSVATHGEKLLAGSVYVSPASRALEVDSPGYGALVQMLPKEIYRPSCNRLLSSAARVYGKTSIGVVLTGMGDDGVQGLCDIASAGGLTIAQDEASSAIYGMPRVAVERGCARKILPLDEVASELMLAAHHQERG